MQPTYAFVEWQQIKTTTTNKISKHRQKKSIANRMHQHKKNDMAQVNVQYTCEVSFCIRYTTRFSVRMNGNCTHDTEWNAVHKLCSEINMNQQNKDRLYGYASESRYVCWLSICHSIQQWWAQNVQRVESRAKCTLSVYRCARNFSIW